MVEPERRHGLYDMHYGDYMYDDDVIGGGWGELFFYLQHPFKNYFFVVVSEGFHSHRWGEFFFLP